MNEPGKRRLRILVIEDSLDTAQTMLFLLRESGHSVEFAINGYAALTVAERQKPDVILVDMGLPDFDGVTLVRRLRRIPDIANTRIIAITGRTSDDDEARALAAGCERFLRKPVDPKVLDAVLSGAPGSANPANVHPLRK
jgi:CheY-like chemotaxis protein